MCILSKSLSGFFVLLVCNWTLLLVLWGNVEIVEELRLFLFDHMLDKIFVFPLKFEVFDVYFLAFLIYLHIDKYQALVILDKPW